MNLDDAAAIGPAGRVGNSASLRTCVRCVMDTSDPDIQFDANFFRQCGGANIITYPAADLLGFTAHGNRFRTGVNTLDFESCIDFSFAPAAISQVHCVGNSWNYQGATKTAILLGPATNFTVVSNYFRDGSITHATAGGAPTATSFGYAEAGQDLNFVDSYL